jgi:hypothetical protein
MGKTKKRPGADASPDRIIDREILGRVSISKSKKPRRQLHAHGSAGGYEEGQRTIEDPTEPGQRYRATVNVRESAIEHMASRGRLNSSQVAAGEKFRQLVETAAIGRQRGIDISNGGGGGGSGGGDPITDEIVRAGALLAAALQAIGKSHAKILLSIVGEGKLIEDVARNWAQAGGIVSGRRAEGYITGTLVDGLNDLVEHWRLEARGAPKRADATYKRFGNDVVVNDSIRASGPITSTGPANEITVGRFGDAHVEAKRPLDRGPMSQHVSGTVHERAPRRK